jgi:putative holliday junction resolvase
MSTPDYVVRGYHRDVLRRNMRDARYCPCYRIIMTLDISVAALTRQLKRGNRLLALDLGTTTIGLAMASFPDGLPTPLKTIRRTKFAADVAAVMAEVRRELISGLIIGLPLNMDGSMGPRAQSTRAFLRNAQRMESALPPAVFMDERLSTQEAHDMLANAGVAGRRRAGIIDGAAAAIILNDALAQMQQILSTDQ